MPDRTTGHRASERFALNGLTIRLVGLISLALLPLGLISIYQTAQVISEAKRMRHAALLFETSAAAQDERETIQQVIGMARALAGYEDLDDVEACTAFMSAFVARTSTPNFAGYITRDGIMECSSTGETIDFSGSEVFERAQRVDSHSIGVDRAGTAIGRPVMLVNHPVRGENGPAGYISVSIPLNVANQIADERGEKDGLQIVTLTEQGQVIAATGGWENAASILPEDVPPADVAARVDRTFIATARGGGQKLYAVVDLVGQSVRVVGSWPVDRSSVIISPLQQQAAIFFPIAMWMAGIAVAYFGVQRLVIRHIHLLRSAMRRFALGDRTQSGLELNNPPTEIADAQRAFNRMALIISEAEQQQQRDLRDREVLLKEVHHRVKNNLQLIASIMNMQSRNARTAETKVMLAGLQRRVNGLAMLHRKLYTSSDMTTVNGGEVLEAVVADVTELSPENELKIDTRIQDVDLFPDQAVPLSMFLAEALTNAVKYVGADEGSYPWIQVKLGVEEDGMVDLVVANSKRSTPLDDPEGDDTGSDGLGSRLMQAFASQMDGEYQIDETDHQYTLRVRFPRRDFQPEGE